MSNDLYSEYQAEAEAYDGASEFVNEYDGEQDSEFEFESDSEKDESEFVFQGEHEGESESEDERRGRGSLRSAAFRGARRQSVPHVIPARKRRHHLPRDRGAARLDAPCDCHGKSSEYVRWLQSALNQVLGQRLPVTGVMNSATRNALQNFQQQQGLIADGIAGPETKRALMDARMNRRAANGRNDNQSGANSLSRSNASMSQSQRETDEEYEGSIDGDFEDEFGDSYEANYDSETEFDFENSFEVGKDAAWVKKLQARLNKVLGLSLPVNGDADKDTHDAIRKFQKQAGLKVDGMAGPNTMRALLKASTGPATASVPSVSVSAPAGANPRWELVKQEDRILYVMERLVLFYKMPVLAAAGLVGNFIRESFGCIPNCVQGSSARAPMTRDTTTYTPDEAMHERFGIGLLQWTYHSRRSSLFRHPLNGVVLGSKMVHSMDGQIDFAIKEMHSGEYANVGKILFKQRLKLSAATSVVFYRFAKSAKSLSADKSVQAGALSERIRSSRLALRIYKNVHP